MTIKDAKQYISFGIKEGYYSPEDFDGWSDEKLVEFAQRESDRGDAYEPEDEHEG